MVLIAPKNNLLFINTSKYQRNVLKNIYIVFQLQHALFSLDFGFFQFKSFRIKVFVKVLSLFQCLCYVYICLSDVFTSNLRLQVSWYVNALIHYVVFVVLLLFIKSDSTFCKLLHDLVKIDRDLRVDQEFYNLDVKIVVVVLINILFRITLTLTFCAGSGVCVLSLFIRILLTFLHASVDFVIITYTFVFYSIYCRLSKLLSVLETENRNIVFLQHIYKAIHDVAEKYKDAFDLIFLSGLISRVPEAMSTIYWSVTELLLKTKTKRLLELCIDSLSVAAALTLTFAPAVCAGMLTTLANQHKVVLYNKLIEQKDKFQRRKIERFIRYVETRDYQFRVFKVIPLDANLISMVLSFCVTYLIVIIQFTHVK